MNERAYAETGYTDIDAEHRTISGHLRGVVEAINQGDPGMVGRVLDAALQAIRAHFQHEERLMLESQFVNLARHKAAHDGFVTDVLRFRKLLAEKGITPDFRRWALGRMSEWFRFHVMANDIELGKHLLAHAAATAPPVRAVA